VIRVQFPIAGAAMLAADLVLLTVIAVELDANRRVVPGPSHLPEQ